MPNTTINKNSYSWTLVDITYTCRKKSPKEPRIPPKGEVSLELRFNQEKCFQLQQEYKFTTGKATSLASKGSFVVDNTLLVRIQGFQVVAGKRIIQRCSCTLARLFVPLSSLPDAWKQEVNAFEEAVSSPSRKVIRPIQFSEKVEASVHDFDKSKPPAFRLSQATKKSDSWMILY